MKPKGKALGSPEDWIEHAKSDLRVAQIAVADAFVRFEQICFHAQQAAEKAIEVKEAIQAAACTVEWAKSELRSLEKPDS